MYEGGMTHNISQETKRLKIDVIVHYVGNNEPYNRNGVTVILNRRATCVVLNVLSFSNRVILAKLQVKRVDTNILQIYAPTTDKPDEDVMGHFKVKVGKRKIEDIVGEHGLCEVNEGGDRLIQFCGEEDFIITNTWFKLPPRRLLTWSLAYTVNYIIINHIDFSLVNKTF